MPLLLVSALFLAFSLPPYLSLDPARSRVPVPADIPWYYPALVSHVGFASVALLAACLQIWPWLRSRHPAWHRQIGRAYVFAGVLPAGVTGLAVGAVSPFGPVAGASSVLLAGLWLGFTLAGWRMMRRARIQEHRRWMIRSVALTMSIITNRFWGVAAALVLMPRLETTFRGDETMLTWTIASLASWLGWTIPLLLTELWLERDLVRRGSAPRPRPEVSPAHAAAPG